MYLSHYSDLYLMRSSDPVTRAVFWATTLVVASPGLVVCQLEPNPVRADRLPGQPQRRDANLLAVDEDASAARPRIDEDLARGRGRWLG